MDPLPCRDGTGWVPEEKHLREWQETYYYLDLEHEWRKMRHWLEAKPQRKKTRRGMRAFVVNWLNRPAKPKPQNVAPRMEDPDAPEDNCDRRFKLLVELKRDRTLTHADRMRILDERYPIK